MFLVFSPLFQWINAQCPRMSWITCFCCCCFNLLRWSLDCWLTSRGYCGTRITVQYPLKTPFHYIHRDAVGEENAIYADPPVRLHSEFFILWNARILCSQTLLFLLLIRNSITHFSDSYTTALQCTSLTSRCTPKSRTNSIVQKPVHFDCGTASSWLHQ